MNYFQLISEISKELEEEGISYHYAKTTSLWIQGVDVAHSNEIFLEVQWDLFEKVKKTFRLNSLKEITHNPTTATFCTQYKQYTIYVKCNYNTTIRTHPYRVKVIKDGSSFWCISLYHYLFDLNQDIDVDLIHEFLHKEQQVITNQNEEAWNQHNYEALLTRHGNPAELAEKIKQNPQWRLHPFYKYFGEVIDKKVIHLMGSNGIKGVALSMLGANVTIVDFSKENQLFAKELSKAAEAPLNYIVSDVLSLPIEKYSNQYDFALMELGVLHYYIDLFPLMEHISNLLRPGGKFILHEFHPISTKLITSSGKKHKVTGNYFDPSIINRDVAFTKHMPIEVKESLEQVLQRKWSLGELITTIGQCGMYIEVLEEEPNHKIHDIGLPKTFTLVARKI